MMRLITAFSAAMLSLFMCGSGLAKGVPNLPLSADYCAILRAFTDAGDTNCPAFKENGPTRSIARQAVPPGDPLDERGYFIRFAFDSDVLTPAFQKHLKELSNVLKSGAMAELCLLLVGHTGNAGTSSYNLSLAKKRAHTVQLYLEGVAGVTPARLGTLGQGEREPLKGVSPADPLNRRVEVLAKPRTDGGCQ